MDPSKSEEIEFEFPPFLRVYKDGRRERILVSENLPPSVHPTTGVTSKDVLIQPETGLSARLFLPKITDPQEKLPLVIYFHGGAFVIETPFSPAYHHYCNTLVTEANVVAISIDYRRAPEHDLPIAYEDSWTSLQWVASQSKEEEWFKNYVDFDSVFMAGDSAGANIAHNMAIRLGVEGLHGFKVDGIVLIHPYFSGSEMIGNEAANPMGRIMGEKIWKAIFPTTSGSDDPYINPVKNPNFSKLGCQRVLVCVAEKDGLRERGRYYYEELGKSGWKGVVEFMETIGENHVFHLFDPACENTKGMMKRIVSFIYKTE